MALWKTTSTVSASIVLAASMLAGSAFAASGFTDIGQSQAKEQIEALYDKGIVTGVTSTAFEPKSSIDAAQGVALIARTFNLSLAAIDFKEAPIANQLFPKVANDAWYAESFINAHFNGLDIPESVDPAQTMTREQFVHYVVQGLESTGQYPLIKMYIPITDEDSINVEYQGTIERALLYKIVSLDDNGNFHPEAPVTREEAAAVLYNALQFVEAHADSGAGSGDTSSGSSETNS
ncbi:S-layer homology domain-containing protein [Paenibacillus protaetiae]|uniref:S-layer homology domain-containing protein n=1 Tax=Paenibacillus protaetiae TaxID=2509456 RepID=A0A4P6ERB9_9BACL|nr:S-layer homology domain-containing protein [Paenibacillus protaetiae]QAY65066.1 S-layer homology domain-containing protein [Paenibacillus protaetiae]